MSNEVKNIFDNELVDTARRHNNESHPPYNKRAGQIFDKFCKNNGIDNPDDITPDQARDFLDELKDDPEIDNFNKAQQEGAPLPIVPPFWEFVLGSQGLIVDSIINQNSSGSE